eukprot:42690-Chlamydomonas_euryale.AAC.1
MPPHALLFFHPLLPTPLALPLPPSFLGVPSASGLAPQLPLLPLPWHWPLLFSLLRALCPKAASIQLAQLRPMCSQCYLQRAPLCLPNSRAITPTPPNSSP